MFTISLQWGLVWALSPVFTTKWSLCSSSVCKHLKQFSVSVSLGLKEVFSYHSFERSCGIFSLFAGILCIGFDYSKNLHIDNLSNSRVKTEGSKNAIVCIA